MSGWAVGDLALCVRSCTETRQGKVYTVNAISAAYVGLVLRFNELLHSEAHCRVWSSANRFRKIKPDTEPCEEEFTVLIKRGRKVSV